MDVVTYAAGKNYTDNEVKRIGELSGAVLSINGKTGEVKGLAEQKSVDALNEQLADTVKLDDTGVLGLNVFDEPTRNILQGQEPGTINAVLGEGNVKGINLADNIVTESKLAFSVVAGEASRNLFNKNDVILGKYVASGTGLIHDSPNYSVLLYKPVEPGETYFVSYHDHLAYFDVNKVYISGEVQKIAAQKITTPPLARFVSLSVPKARLDSYQFEKGGVGTPWQPYGGLLKLDSVGNEQLAKNAVGKENIQVKAVSRTNLDFKLRKSILEIGETISNPLSRSNIKCIGDSITAGVGGTGYSLTGEIVGGDALFFGATKNANTPTAVCWANMLRQYVDSNLNKEFVIPFNDKSIGYANTYDITRDATALSLTKLYLPNNHSTSGRRKALEFDFWGDSISVYYFGTSGGGIINVDIDGVVNVLDTYSLAYTANMVKVISGLGNGKHKVIIYETKTKNVSSTGTSVYLSAFKVFKNARVKNWGVSGINSRALYDNIHKLVEEDDDVIVIQIGTNDRIDYARTEDTTAYINLIIDYIYSRGKEVILMTANPTTPTNDIAQKWKMHQIVRAIKNSTDSSGIEMISNYQHFIDIATFTGSYTNLLNDALHPNDAGYKVIYKNIMKHLGIPIDTTA